MKTIILILSCLITITSSAQWKSLMGPYGGRVWSYANEGTSCYVTTSNGFYRSDDDGENWIRLDKNLPQNMEGLGFCVHQDEVFLSYHNFFTQEYGFVYSNDKGENWQQLPLPEPNWGTFEITYKNGILISTYNSGIIESIDKGRTWSASSLNGRLRNVWNVESNNSYFFITDISGVVYRRSFHDTTWQKIFDSPDYFFTFHVSDSVVIIIPDDKAGYRSLDNGTTWDKMNLSGFNSDQMIAEFGDTIYYGSVDKVYRSLDRGLKWNVIKTFDFNAIYFNDVLRVGKNLMGNHFSSGLLKTEDEFQTFEPSSKGIYAESCHRMFATDSFMFVLGDISIGTYNFLTGQWKSKSYIFNDYVDELYYYQDVLYVLSTFNDTIYISKDRGQTFQSRSLGVFFNSLRYSKIFGYQNKILISDGWNLIASDDKGETWNEVEVRDWSTGTGDFINYSDVEIYEDKVVVMAIDDQGLYKLYSSTDLIDWKGERITFQRDSIAKSGPLFLNAPGSLFATNFVNGNCRLFKLDTVAMNFELCEGIGDLCDKPFPSRNRLVANGDKMIAVIENGYYYSEDAGLHWKKVIDEFGNLTTNIFRDMLVKDNRLYASCYYIGVVHIDWDEIKSGSVKGLVYNDKNYNNIFDGMDNPLEGAFVQLKRSGSFLPVDKNGNYSFIYSAAIKDTLFPEYYVKYGSFTPDRLAFLPGDTSLDFAYHIPPQIEDLSLDMTGITRARPGFKYYLDLNVQNMGALPCSGKLLLEFIPEFRFQTASISPQNILSNSLIWDLTDIASLESRKIHVEFIVSDTVSLNTPFEFKAELQNLSCNDIDLSDNLASLKDGIVGSYDPNEIIVDKSEISKKDIENKIPLTYTIRFQNVGNYEAEFVEINNNLSNFDISTLKMIEASHPYSFNIDENNLLVVNFDMIHLPDSMSNESKSHGYLKYSISFNPKNVLVNKILNHASIYFDFNNPIHTNEAITRVVDIVSNKDWNINKDQRIVVIPNPNHGEFQIFSPYLEKEENTTIQIFNLQGECVSRMQDKLYDGYKFQLGGIKPGIYFLQLGNSEKLVCKIVITD